MCQKAFLFKRAVLVCSHTCVCVCACMHKHAHVESKVVSCLPDVVRQVFVVDLAWLLVFELGW